VTQPGPVRIYETNAQYNAKMACRDYVMRAHKEVAEVRWGTALGGAANPVERLNDDWLEQELMAVTVAANNWATANGGHAVTIDQVRLYDELATGSDWGSKLALYVAQAVIFGETRQP